MNKKLSMAGFSSTLGLIALLAAGQAFAQNATFVPKPKPPGSDCDYRDMIGKWDYLESTGADISADHFRVSLRRNGSGNVNDRFTIVFKNAPGAWSKIRAVGNCQVNPADQSKTYAITGTATIDGHEHQIFLTRISVADDHPMKKYNRVVYIQTVDNGPAGHSHAAPAGLSKEELAARDALQKIFHPGASHGGAD